MCRYVALYAASVANSWLSYCINKVTYCAETWDLNVLSSFIMDWKLIMMSVGFCSSVVNLLGGRIFLRCSGHQPVKLMAQTLVYCKFQSLCSTSSKRYGLQHGIVAVKMRLDALGMQWSTFSESKSQVCLCMQHTVWYIDKKNWHLDIYFMGAYYKTTWARTPAWVKCTRMHFKYIFWP